MSLIDMLIATMEHNHLLPEEPPPQGAGGRHVSQFDRTTETIMLPQPRR
jgi:hypothetical protein